MPKIFPSLISADLLNLRKVIQELEPFVAGFHLDVMDFHFAPNLTWGPDFINAIRQATKKQLWVHLMVDSPGLYIPLLKLKPQDIVSVHIEGQSFAMTMKLLELIAERHWISSIALKPDTPLSVLAPLLAHKHAPEQILLMSVNPGFSGQKFIPYTASKLKELVTLRAAAPRQFTIGMDGGINLQNIAVLVQAGVDEVALASAIFDAKDPIKVIKELEKF